MAKNVVRINRTKNKGSVPLDNFCRSSFSTKIYTTKDTKARNREIRLK